MRILSWDIGIINLSYCILENLDNKIVIKEWNVINLEEQIPIITCSAKCKNDNNCSRKAIFLSKDKNLGYCRIHYKMVDIECKEIKKTKKKKEDLLTTSSKLINELKHSSLFQVINYFQLIFKVINHINIIKLFPILS